MAYATDGQLAKDIYGAPAEGVYVPGIGTVSAQGGTLSGDKNGQPYAPQLQQVVDSGGVNLLGVDAFNTAYVSSGGKSTVAIAAGTSANTVVKGSAGRLCRVLVTTSGTAAVSIYDNATTNTGTIIGSIVASAAAGTIVDFQLPAANGITVAGNASLPALTVSFS